MTSGHWYVLHDINPEPWKVGPASVSRRGSKLITVIGQDQQLRAFQDAVREVITKAAVMIDGDLELKFFFWRQLASYEGARKRIVKHQVDATNMQKATEDALQGLVMDNDNAVRHIETTIVEQGVEVEPKIVIFADAWEGFGPNEIPHEIWERIDRAPQLLGNDEDSNVWPPRS